MPAAHVVFFKEGDRIPVLEWLNDLKNANRKGFANGMARIRLLKQEGFELDRPAAGFLGNGIYELRWKDVHVQFRILYFFHGRNTAVLTHAFHKKGAEVPSQEIERAMRRKGAYSAKPDAHKHEKEIDDV